MNETAGPNYRAGHCLVKVALYGLGQTSLFSCAEPNVNEEKSLF